MVGESVDRMPFGFQAFDWDFLLDYMLDADEQVIPVVGWCCRSLYFPGFSQNDPR